MKSLELINQSNFLNFQLIYGRLLPMYNCDVGL